MKDLKDRIKQDIAHQYYERYLHTTQRNGPMVSVQSVDETISMLQNTNKSLVRFGDGEIAMIRGRDLKLQKSDPELRRRLVNLLGNPYVDLAVSVQDIFRGLEIYRPASQLFWEDHFLFYHGYYRKYCRKDQEYATTLFSRCYITLMNTSHCQEWFDRIRAIWSDKDVVIVEGVRTHNGVGNDLMSRCKSVERILIPPTDAFASYDRILKACKECRSDKIFLLSAGACAKPLAEDLFRSGYRVIDIGNLDMEYEWFHMKARDKCPISKHAVVGRTENMRAGYCQYLDEVREEIE